MGDGYRGRSPAGSETALRKTCCCPHRARRRASRSSSGYGCGTLGRVTFVGSHTTGATGTAFFINLPGGAQFSFTSQRVRYADGSRFQNIGITPDVVVEPTIDGIRQGRDEVLEKGIDVLRKAVAGQPRQR